MKTAHLVCKVPDRDSDTSLNRMACGDNGLVVGLLLCDSLCRRRERLEADIELGERDLNPERGEFLQVLLERVRHLPNNQVRLDPDPVDGNALPLEFLDEILHRCRFRAWGTYDVRGLTPSHEAPPSTAALADAPMPSIL